MQTSYCVYVKARDVGVKTRKNAVVRFAVIYSNDYGGAGVACSVINYIICITFVFFIRYMYLADIESGKK